MISRSHLSENLKVVEQAGAEIRAEVFKALELQTIEQVMSTDYKAFSDTVFFENPSEVIRELLNVRRPNLVVNEDGYLLGEVQIEQVSNYLRDYFDRLSKESLGGGGTKNGHFRLNLSNPQSKTFRASILEFSVRSPVIVSTSTSLSAVARIFQKRDCLFLPVVQKGVLKGVISQADVLRIYMESGSF